MQNADQWRPSKYVVRDGRLAGSRDTRELGAGSRLIADLVAARYDEALPRHARGRLVDLGCGKVPLYATYRPHVAEVTCVDWDASAHACPHVDVRADLGEPLPFADAAFDTAICSDVLEHVPSAERLTAEIARLLAPGGHLLLNVPFLYGVHEAPHDYARYTRFALARLATRAGLDVLDLQPIGGSVDVFADLLAKHLAHLPRAGGDLASIVQSAAAAIGRTPGGTRLRARTSERFTLGWFMVARRPGPA